MMHTSKYMVALLSSGLLFTACDPSDPVVTPDPADTTQIQEAQERRESDADDATEDDTSDTEAAADEYPDEPTIGQLAPDFTLQDETGETYTLSELRGQTVVLEWFNVPCPYVRRHYEEGTFDKLVDEFGGDDLTWLAIDTTWDNTPEDSIARKEELNENRTHDYPILQDPSGEVGRLYKARTTPHMFVIDPDGILRYMGGIDDDPRGRMDASERTNYVHAALTALAAGEDVPTTEAEPYGCTVKYSEDD